MRSTCTLGLAVAALALIGSTLAPTPATAQAGAADLAGRWEGQVTFVTGHRARVELELEPGDPGLFQGAYTLTMLGEDGPETPSQGRVEATAAEGGAVSFALVGRLLQAQGRLASAGNHAERALYGLFDAGREGQGTFMVWRYRR